MPPPDAAVPHPGARRSAPPAGWVLMALGVLIIVGSLAPWVSLDFLGSSRSVRGTSGDGVLTLVSGLVVLVMGLGIGLGRGRLVVALVALVFAVFVSFVGAVDIANIDNQFGAIADGDAGPSSVSTGYGLYLVLGSGLLACAVSVVALVRRG